MRAAHAVHPVREHVRGRLGKLSHLASVRLTCMGLLLTSDESRTECLKTWSRYDNGRQLVPGYYCVW